MSKTTRRLGTKAHAPHFEQIVDQVKTDKHIREITSHELKAHLDNHDPVIVIDVREGSEREQFYIDGSIHISKGVIERDVEHTLSEDDSDKLIVTVCSGGYRSILAAASLIDMGYTNVCSLAGGLRDYLEQDFDNLIELEENYTP